MMRPACPRASPNLDRVTGGGFRAGLRAAGRRRSRDWQIDLLIQAAAALARAGHRAVYISGEEAVAQVRLRAERLGLRDRAVELAAETVGRRHHRNPFGRQYSTLIVIDFIETMWTGTVESLPAR